MKIKELTSNILYLAYPETCAICQAPLTKGEHEICMECLYNMPKINAFSYTKGPVAEKFYGKIKFEKAASFFFYRKKGSIQKAIELLKYKNGRLLGYELGKFIASELTQKNFFSGIDIIIPVPLHKKRQKKRGYNQSEWISKGISKITGIQTNTTAIERTKETETQTKKQIWDRWKNTSGIFTLSKKTNISNKHILLIDDVMTSGSTLESCGNEILKKEGTKISFLTLAAAIHNC